MKSNNRREFLKKSALASAAAITLPSWLSSCNSKREETPTDEIRSRLIVPKNNALKITGTFWTRYPMTSPTKIGEKKNGMLTSGI